MKVLRTLLTAFLLSSAYLVESIAAPQPLDTIIAVVEDDVIMASELARRVQQVKLQNTGAKLPNDKVLTDQVLENMVMESIQLQLANRVGIQVDEAQLNQAVEGIAKQNGMSLSQFRASMEAEGMSFSEAREQIRNELRTSQIQRFSVGDRIKITDQDVDFFLASDLGKMTSAAEYRLQHILIDVPSEASPEQYQQAQQEANDLVTQLRNGDDFAATAIAKSASSSALKGGDLGWRKEAQLPRLFVGAATQLQVGEIAEVISTSSGFHIIKLAAKRGGSSKLITQTKVRHILLRTNELRDQELTKTEIADIHQKLQAGDDFAELARQYSDDPGSGSNGGDLGWVNPGDMVPAFDQMMAQTDVQQLSEPFESQFGWHVLLVEGRRETDIGKQLQRSQVRQMLYSRRFEEELPIWLRKTRSEAFVDIRL